MKKWQIFGIFAILILGFLLISGCSQDNYQYCRQHFPGTIYDPSSKMCEHTSTPTPTPTSTPKLKVVTAPGVIIGVWADSQRASESRYYVHTISFKPDGTYVEKLLMDGWKADDFGTWHSQDGNSYVMEGKLGNSTYYYNPVQDLICSDEFPDQWTSCLKRIAASG